MRTDSVRISDEAQGKAIEFIEENYGKEYLPREQEYIKERKIFRMLMKL